MPQFYEPPFPDHLISPLSEGWALHGLGDRFPAINPISATAVRMEAIESTYVCLSSVQSGMLADPLIAIDDTLAVLPIEEAEAERDVMEFFIGGVCSNIGAHAFSQDDAYSTFGNAVRRSTGDTMRGIEDGWFGEPIFGQVDVLAGLARSLRAEESLHILHHAQETRLSRSASAILRQLVDS